jgi:hypothetical protein
MERGEFRKLPAARSALHCTAAATAIWRTTFASMDTEPTTMGMIDAHIQTLLRGLQPDEPTQWDKIFARASAVGCVPAGKQ